MSTNKNNMIKNFFLFLVYRVMMLLGILPKTQTFESLASLGELFKEVAPFPNESFLMGFHLGTLRGITTLKSALRLDLSNERIFLRHSGWTFSGLLHQHAEYNLSEVQGFSYTKSERLSWQAFFFNLILAGATYFLVSEALKRILLTSQESIKLWAWLLLLFAVILASAIFFFSKHFSLKMVILAMSHGATIYSHQIFKLVGISSGQKVAMVLVALIALLFFFMLFVASSRTMLKLYLLDSSGKSFLFSSFSRFSIKELRPNTDIDKELNALGAYINVIQKSKKQSTLNERVDA